MGFLSGIVDSVKNIVTSPTGIGTAIGAATGMPWLGTVVGSLGDMALDVGGSALQQHFVTQPAADRAYEQNLASTTYAMNKSAEMADHAMDRSEDAATTAYDRSVDLYGKRYQMTMKDMEAAGLNPILAATGGISVGPSPQMASPQMTPGQGFSAKSHLPRTPTFQATSSVSNMASAHESKKRSVLLNKQADESIAKAASLRKQAGLFSAQEQNTLAQYWKAKQEFNLITQQAYRTLESRRLQQEEIKVIKLKAASLAATLVKLEKHANVYRGAKGQVMTYIQETMRTLGSPIAGLAGGAAALKLIK